MDPATVKIELLELFERHGLKVAVGLTSNGVAIRSQDTRVDAQNLGPVRARPLADAR